MKRALHFSGGKDSLACLYLLKDEWPSLNVYWVNTGAVYDEVKEYMASWKRVLPNFFEVQGSQPDDIKEFGFPTDILPIRNTVIGHGLEPGDRVLLQSFTDCCYKNMWLPMLQTMKDHGVQEIIRGTRKEDTRKSPVMDGDIVNGIKYSFPIFNWTLDQVWEFLLREEAIVPTYYMSEMSSRDCWDCTAYLDHNKQRIANLPDDRRRVVLDRIRMIKEAIAEANQVSGLENVDG
jgi:phosphoadenosine phosphosulfate reductase